MTAPAPKQGFLSSLLSPLTGADVLAMEKARLEAFLNAFPGEYCGFNADGSTAYSDGFCALLGLSVIRTIEDVQARLTTSDSAVLEGLFYKLEQEHTPFSITVHLDGSPKILRLRGAIGQASDRSDAFRILWAEDVTSEEDTLAQIKSAREAAENYASQLENTQNLMGFPVWVRDGTGTLTCVNQAYATLLGTSIHDVLDGQVEIPLSQKTSSKSLKDLSYLSLNEGRGQTISSHVISGGKRKWMQFHIHPLPASHKTIGYAVDMTAQEDTENTLSRHLTANKSLLEQLRAAVAIFAADHSLEFYNSAYAQLWGLEEQYLNTKPKLGDILERLRENRKLPEQADFRSYKQDWLDKFTKLIDPDDDMMYLPDGSAIRSLVIAHPMGGLMMTFEDVTSRLELESSYNTLIAVQRETLDNLTEGVVVYGSDGRMKLWNPSFARLWDMNPEELLDQPHINKIVEQMQGHFARDTWPDIKNSLLSQALDRSVREGQFIRTDGIHLRYATQPLPDGGVMVSYYDITDSAKVENALREKNAALETAEQLKTDFLANVSYQFRTPLNAIMGFAEILENQYFGELNNRQKEYTSGIRESGERLVSLIDDILDLSTIEAGYLELSKTNVDVPPLLFHLIELTEGWAQKHKLDIKLSCPDNIQSIYADDRRIKQILLNLIRNAINFTPEGGKITLWADNIGDKVKITVQDTGIGIKPEDLARVFTPFEKSSTSKSNGAGLGLALVKNIVELHGGNVAIESTEGHGTTVTLLLPH